MVDIAAAWNEVKLVRVFPYGSSTAEHLDRLLLAVGASCVAAITLSAPWNALLPVALLLGWLVLVWVVPAESFVLDGSVLERRRRRTIERVDLARIRSVATEWAPYRPGVVLRLEDDSRSTLTVPCRDETAEAMTVLKASIDAVRPHVSEAAKKALGM